MEKTYSLWHRKNRWGLTILALVILIIASPVSGLTLFLPNLFTAVPLLVVVLLANIGPVSAVGAAAVFCLVFGSVSSLLGAGWLGFVGSAVFLVPFLVASSYLAEHKQGFWLSVAVSAGTMFISSLTIITMIRVLSGVDAVSAIVGLLREAIRSVEGMDEALAAALRQAGLIAGAFGGSLQGDGAQTAAQLVERALSALDAMMRLQVPMQITTGSLVAGLFGQAALRRVMLHEGADVSYTPFTAWCVPKGWGKILGGTFALLYLMAYLSPARMQGMFYVFSGVSEQIFALQGISALCFVLEERGRGKRTKLLVLAIGYLLLQTPALLFGIADQAFDVTHRRVKIGETDALDPFRSFKKDE